VRFSFQSREMKPLMKTARCYCSERGWNMEEL